MSNMAGTKRSADSSETKTFKKQKFDKSATNGGSYSKKPYNAADKYKKPAYTAGKETNKDVTTVLNGMLRSAPPLVSLVSLIARWQPG